MLNIAREANVSNTDLTLPQVRELTLPELVEVAGGDYKIEFEVPPVTLVVAGGDNWGSICLRVGNTFGCITNHGSGQLFWSGGPVSGPVSGGPIRTGGTVANPPR